MRQSLRKLFDFGSRTQRATHLVQSFFPSATTQFPVLAAVYAGPSDTHLLNLAYTHPRTRLLLTSALLMPPEGHAMDRSCSSTRRKVAFREPMTIKVPTVVALPALAIVHRPYSRRSECRLVDTAHSALIQFRSDHKPAPWPQLVYHLGIQARGTQ